MGASGAGWSRPGRRGRFGPATGVEWRSWGAGPGRRTYGLVRGPAAGAPLIVALHGAGGTGRGMVALTGLGTRGPAAGFAVAFPDGVRRAWGGGRAAAGRVEVDDAGFLTGLVDGLVAEGVARPGALVLCGMSNGGFMVEYLARRHVLGAVAVLTVAATATEVARLVTPVPVAPCAVVCVTGTADPIVPYGGGPVTLPGPLGRRVARRRTTGTVGRNVAATAGAMTSDWATANGLGPTPVVETFPAAPGDVGYTRFTWQAPGRRPVVHYRIDGGGHTWPGGPQYLPGRMIGPTARTLDATAVLLALAAGELRTPGGSTGPATG